MLESPGSNEREMTQEAVNLLREKMGVARGFDVSQDDIDSAVKFLVTDADRRGEPYTKEEIERFDMPMQTRVLDALVKRIQSRAGPAAAHVVDSKGDVIGPVGSVSEAQGMIERERGQEK